jgi:hypothetical protein
VRTVGVGWQRAELLSEAAEAEPRVGCSGLGRAVVGVRNGWGRDAGVGTVDSLEGAAESALRKRWWGDSEGTMVWLGGGTDKEGGGGVHGVAVAETWGKRGHIFIGDL